AIVPAWRILVRRRIILRLLISLATLLTLIPFTILRFGLLLVALAALALLAILRLLTLIALLGIALRIGLASFAVLPGLRIVLRFLHPTISILARGRHVH